MSKLLETKFCGIKLENPTILASGILGVSKGTLKIAARGGAGAVTIKSISIEPRTGHKNPSVIAFETGLMNAVGYSNAGLENAKEEFGNLKDVKVPVIGSAIGKTAEEFAEVVSVFDKMDFDAVEIPLSCPHTPGYGTLAGHSSPEKTAEITKACRKATKKALIVKLSPNIPRLGEVAKAAEKAGADAIAAVNSMGPGMIIDINTGKPVLDFKMGGISGPALKPIAVRCVYDIYKSVKIPILGTGGITTGEDGIEMIQAGATAIGVGSAVYYRGMNAFKLICREMEMWMKENKVKNLDDIRGIAHE